MAERNLRVLQREVAVGTAVLYREDRLEKASQGNAASAGSSNTRVAVCLRGRHSSPLAALGPTAIVSLHLDAGSEAKRVDQVRGCLALARQMGVRELVIAGDMNTACALGSCVGAFARTVREPSAEELLQECASALRLSACGEGDGEDDDVPAQAAEQAGADAFESPTPEQLAEWVALRERAIAATKEHRIVLERVPTGPTRAGYDHGKDCGPCVSWSLDHIFYTSRTLRLCNFWATLEADPESVATGLPNHTCPSDHLPVAATFSVSPTPSLGEAQRLELESRVAKLEAEQALAREALDKELKSLEPAKAVEPAAPAEGAGKKKAKKSEKPPPEVIAHIQLSRKRTRELKEAQVEPRRALVSSLDELQRDALDELLCVAAWVDTGARQSRNG